MSIRRLIATAGAMALVALVLAALTPGLDQLAATLSAPQSTADTLGPDALVLALVGVLSWAVWAWGALGLALTAGSAMPGLLGAASRAVLHVLVPAGARHSAAVLLGLGVGVAAPLFPVLPALGTPPAAAAAPAVDPVPDWPAAVSPAPPVADWPTGSPAGAAVADWPSAGPAGHVVVRGDCLWHLAESGLTTGSGEPTDAEIARAVAAWWRTNADVIGPDPDRLLPGQVLQPPTSSEELP
jgi:hypothetical protein